METRTAVVVAGGYSTRFGEADKAVADVAGVPMVRRVADRLADAVEALVVNCRRDQRPAIRTALAGYPHPVRYALDRTPDRGPLAGIATGLDAVDAEYAFVVACDMPFVDPAFVDYLFARATDADVDAVVPRPDDGWYQTTHAVYRADAMARAAADALARDEHKILTALETLDWLVVEGDAFRRHASFRVFENVNTPAELRAAERRLADEDA